MGSYEKDLIGASIPLMETDTEPSLVDNTLIYNSEIGADINDLVNNIGKESFQSIYLNVLNEIKNMDLENKRNLCGKLSDKIYDIYSFEFNPKLDFNNNYEADQFLKFVEFLEFNYIDVLSVLLEGGDYDLLKKYPDEFLNKYWNLINNKIENESFSVLISKFFRTNIKENILEFIKSRIEKDKMLIILRIMERGIKNE